ncbi:bifunctional folylpolyglutamate synthase/dihydrofolate synthase [Thiomicrorhabdus arctica]|jgi:dihydrofolate synthase/folylpolyglutamate synthase|uniref:bifunctional folylpolyglutamate synthase/dihydrofolate synthase n=1 Tax=Thiomicrorhabdus arctica TaxID=131540 RepID=UPI00036AC5E8|nr:folylpolyglutamate synthase/dihydrofolate synthase family protein [Thiomicrorhabdus arctica]
MIIPNRHSSLTDWVDWLLQLHAQEIDLGLDRIRLVANAMQLTKPAPLVISVAGTNGKGSSVALLVAILKAAGHQVGAYTSPHIQFFNERIQINGNPVSDDLIIEAFVAIEEARAQTKLTYFEFSTLAALYLFKRAQLEVVVLEVGLGGRLDAVNIIDADAALITAIDIDHVDWLGDDRSVIATEKAGIMRRGKPAVCSDMNPPASLMAYANEHAVPLSQFKVDFDVLVNDQAWSFTWLTQQNGVQLKGTLDDLPFPALKGAFQLNNAAGVIALLFKFTAILRVDRKAINLGLQQVSHPGRLQSLKIGAQSWLIDVAHNPQSALALATYLQQQQAKHTKLQYLSLFSVLNDKDALPMVQQIAPFVSTWLIVDLEIPRATSVNALRVLLKAAGVEDLNIITKKSMEDAVSYAKSCAVEDVLVWGSFFTVSQVLASLAVKKPISKTEKAHG